MSLTELRLPELGEGVAEGELIKWLVKPGDSVKPDQAVAELMTDKATVEVPATGSGIVKELKFKAGDTVKVDSVLLTFEGGAAQAKSSPAKTSSAQTPPASNKAATPADSESAAPSGGGGRKEVRLPELGEGVNEGELLSWKVKVGDQVKADQTIAEMMTDKASVEVPSPVAGKVVELKFEPGAQVKVESVLLILETTGGTNATPSPAANKTSAPATPTLSAKAPTSSSSARPASGGLETYPPPADFRVLATPATRRLARELSLDINQVQGTGLAGRVTREDVMKFQSDLTTKGGGVSTSGMTSPAIPRPAYTSSAGAQDERVPLKGIRKKIAQNLQMAKAIIPHFTLMDEADVSALVTLRETLKEYAEKRGTKVTYLPFVMKALIATIREFPMFNASIDDQAEEIVYKKQFNIGFAADTPQGLVVPVVKAADRKSILEISAEILDLSKRARDGKLKLDEMRGATITITNIGSVGGTYATPIINHPEVAILGMYKIQEKPVIEDGQLKAIKVMNYTITADHRLIDGAVAANFLKAFIGRMQNPGQLMMEMH